MALAVHVLACLLGTGSWVAINGLWVELPLLVPGVPEGWFLPSYLTVVIQLGNVGPLLVALLHRFLPGRVNEVGIVYGILSFGCLACLLLAFFWRETSVVGGSPRSVALLSLLFFLALVDCTSSVTFLPYMRRLQPGYLTTYFVGEGLSGFLPGLVALGQGVGVAHCANSSHAGNATRLQVVYQDPHFSVRTFFLFLSSMMAVSLVAFVLLNHLPAARQERAKEKYQARLQIENPNNVRGAVEDDAVARRSSSRSWSQMGYIFGVLAWVNALTNGTMPAVQSYSCLPYGNFAYHLSATLAALANPLACFLGMFLPNRSLALMGGLALAGSLLAGYIMTTAVLSPCPPLLHLPAGVTLIVLCWVLFVGSLSYVKLMTGLVLRDEGHWALVWCGVVVQVGSMVGALTIFPVVSVYGLFHSGDPCDSSCPG
ncbi:riboflavin transporter 2-like [Eublepharis macularius]|uniref:Riboflavin transporter n=1 Tax=Eublepharis macularius TaxID=481883 RepID=A0AA97JQZ6_EUBMA|nr:riboflavin transporter 2-like [Eublepharis macularius]